MSNKSDLLPSKPDASPDLLTDEEIKQALDPFWDKYAGKGLSPNEVRELHFNELYNEVGKAYYKVNYPFAFEAGKKEQRNEDTVIWKEQQQQIAKLKADVNTLYQKEKGDFWYWQDDSEDHLESIICPILIKADDLRDLLKEQAEKDRAEIEQLQSQLTSQRQTSFRLTEALAEAEKRGARELAEWANKGACLHYPYGHLITKCTMCWQAKLKSLEER